MVASLLITLSGSLAYGAEVMDLVTGYKPNSTTPKVIALTQAAPVWDANIATFNSFIGDVHCILGYDNFMGGLGFADIIWKDTDEVPNDLLGLPAEVPFVVSGYDAVSGNAGFVVYKFSLPSGYITASGGVIDANIVFRGDRTASYNNKTWLGVGPTFTPSSTNFVEPANLGSYTKGYMTGGTTGEWDTFTQQMSLAIPAGYNEFYIVIAREFGGFNRFGFHKLRITAAMVEGTPSIPDVPVYDKFRPGYYPNAVTPKQIMLSDANPSWDANLVTAPAFASDVHCIMGTMAADHNYADVLYRKTDGGFLGAPAQAPYVLCGATANGGNVGSFVYKFVVPEGMVTNVGGTITAGIDFRGDRTYGTQKNWIGISSTFVPNASGNFTELDNAGSFTKSYMTGGTAGEWATFTQQMTLNIPSGVSVFYVAVVHDWASANRFGIYSMSVDAVLKEGIMPVMMYRMPDNRLLKYELDRMVTNDIGMSGATLGGWNVADDPNATGGINTAAVKDSYKDIVTAGANVSPAMKHFSVKSYMGYTTANWPANTWAAGTAWTKAIAQITSMAQACAYAGIRHINLDGERYTGLDQVGLSGTYLMFLTDATSLSNAYQRGFEVAQAISAAAPEVDVILAPEMGTGYMGNTSTYPAWHRFRNGLLDGSSTLKVYMYVEGTYAANTGVNDTSTQIYGVAGSFTDPALYKTALTNYLTTINTNIRNRTDTPSKWDARGGVVPGIWVLGTANDRPGKRSSWYNPELFAAQLEAYAALNVPLVWEYAPLFAWKQWFGNEVSAAGMYQYDGNANPDNNNNWVAEVSCNPYLEAYKAVLLNRGMPSPQYVIPQSGDINGDSYVNMLDVKEMANQWLLN